MNFGKLFKPGDEIRVKYTNGYFTTKIYKVTGDDALMIFRKPEVPVPEPGEKYSVACVTERGLYIFEAKVFGVDNTFMVLELRATGELAKMQRRGGFRVRESLPVKILKSTSDPSQCWVETNAVDISEGGIRVRYNASCPIGQPMKMTVLINKYGMNVDLFDLKGKVVRCVKTDDREFGYMLGIQFEDLPHRARNEIIKFVILSQRSAMNEAPFKRYRNNGERHAN